jgi:hypothetical protein
MCPATSEAHAHHMMNDDLTRTLVRERQRDLARIASSSRLTRRFRRIRRKRNPVERHVTELTVS